MKVIVEQIEKEGETDFEPYQVTFVIRNKEEAVRLHDRAAIRITQGPHHFLAEAHKRTNGRKSENTHFDI